MIDVNFLNWLILRGEIVKLLEKRRKKCVMGNWTLYDSFIHGRLLYNFVTLHAAACGQISKLSYTIYRTIFLLFTSLVICFYYFFWKIIKSSIQKFVNKLHNELV